MVIFLGNSMADLKIFKAKDFVEPLCIGRWPDLLDRLASHANMILRERLLEVENENRDSKQSNNKEGKLVNLPSLK